MTDVLRNLSFVRLLFSYVYVRVTSSSQRAIFPIFFPTAFLILSCFLVAYRFAKNHALLLCYFKLSLMFTLSSCFLSVSCFAIAIVSALVQSINYSCGWLHPHWNAYRSHGSNIMPGCEVLSLIYIRGDNVVSCQTLFQKRKSAGYACTAC